jgi:hypothetical protein
MGHLDGDRQIRAQILWPRTPITKSSLLLTMLEIGV